jgi:DNA-directed RNA polymerase subunit RPC12/RpoP
MAITVKCKSCGTQFRAKEEWIGKRAKCSYCGRIIVIKRVYGVAPGVQTMKAPAGKDAPATNSKSKPLTPAPPPTTKDEEKKEAVAAEPTSKVPGPEEKSKEEKVLEINVPPLPQKKCVTCGKDTLSFCEIEEEDGRKRRAASQGKEEYSHAYYKALSGKQGYKCAGCSRIFCEKCLMEASTRKTNVENIVCRECGGKLEIRR